MSECLTHRGVPQIWTYTSYSAYKKMVQLSQPAFMKKIHQHLQQIHRRPQVLPQIHQAQIHQDRL